VILRPAAAPHARELVVDADAPVAVRVAIGDRTAVFEPTAHLQVPLVGFTPGETTEVVIEADGAEIARFAVSTPPLPDRVPIVEVLAYDQDRVEPGWTLANVSVPREPVSYVVLLDERGAIVWLWESPIDVGDVRLHDDGWLWGLAGGVFTFDWLGRFDRHWAPVDRGLGPWTPIEVASGLHHELIPVDGGFLTLDDAVVPVDDYPGVGDVDVEDPRVVEYGVDGAIRSVRAMSPVLDTHRVRENSLDAPSGAYEWAYANGAAVDVDGSVVVSLRHQDALVKLDAEGQLVWILGDPEGWRPDLAPYLLAPVGEPFAWPYHQHAPEIGPDGVIAVYDNHTLPGVRGPSRGVVYRVDELARTVSQVRETPLGGLFSAVMGDADLQPTTGNLLVDHAYVVDEGDGPVPEWGEHWVRLAEHAPDGTIVADFRLRSDAADEPTGWKMYRAERIASPWPASVGGWE
jgi:arylsulfate sulfotransferase